MNILMKENSFLWAIFTVAQHFGVSAATIRRWVHDDANFPRPIGVGPRAVHGGMEDLLPYDDRLVQKGVSHAR